MTDINDNFSKKAKASHFQQQTLPSWNPLILISTIYPFFGSVGIVFIMIGVALFLNSMRVSQFKIDYTDCFEYDEINKNDSTRKCSDLLDRNMTSNYLSCTCKISFNLTKFNGQVYLYYSLKNFYQNHRTYFGSRDDNQLVGKVNRIPSQACKPFWNEKTNGSDLYYAPCGLIANSLFNDTFELIYKNGSANISVSMTNKDISWKSDVDILFGKPTDWENTIKPVNWPKSALERNNDSYKGDEELQVWMRTAPLSEFKKLNRIVIHDTEPFINGLPTGDYELIIKYAYPVTIFGGKKMVYIGTTSAMGGKNNNMGFMYIILGSIHEAIAFAFFIFTFFKRNNDKNNSNKNHGKDTPLIMLPLTPESYGGSDDRELGSKHTSTR